VPTVILYWISRPAYFVQGIFRKSKYITLVNLLADYLNNPRDGESARANRATQGWQNRRRTKMPSFSPSI